MQEDKNTMRFPQKLWHLLNLGTDVIMWGGTGRTILMNYKILHNYLQRDYSVFKTTNISSFVRQLNLYGFRKVTSHLQDPLCNSSNPYMHEYVHDCFRYGRPELLNNITRKPFTIKRHLQKPQMMCDNETIVTEPCPNMTPLQKARLNLKKALLKAKQDFMMHHLQKTNILFEYHDETPEDFNPEQENVKYEWADPESMEQDHIIQPETEMFENNITKTEEDYIVETNRTEIERNDSTEFNEGATIRDNTNYGEFSSQENQFMNFNNMSTIPWQTNPEGFPTQLLSLPCTPEPTQSDSTIELLAEFNIEQDIDQGITQRIEDKNTLLNCVLPSVGNDSIFNITMERRSQENSDIDGEWDQMLDDIIINREPSSGSDLKELYSQISRTIDLLNS